MNEISCRYPGQVDEADITVRPVDEKHRYEIERALKGIRQRAAQCLRNLMTPSTGESALLSTTNNFCFTITCHYYTEDKIS